MTIYKPSFIQQLKATLMRKREYEVSSILKDKRVVVIIIITFKTQLRPKVQKVQDTFKTNLSHIGRRIGVHKCIRILKNVIQACFNVVLT